MDRLTRMLQPHPRNPLLGRQGKGSGDSDMVSVPTRLTWARQALDLAIIAGTLFAAIIVLNEPANRRWSVAMGPTYQEGQKYALVAANWAHRKVLEARATWKASTTAPAESFQSTPEVMLAMEEVDDAPRLEDRSPELVEGDSSAPTVGTLKLQQVGRTRNLRSKPLVEQPVVEHPEPETVPRYEPKAGPAIDDFPVQLRLE